VRALAFSIHILTASGAALALLALLAAVRGDWPSMFLWLGAALLVDAIDGPLARRFRVAEIMPRWSGETLDLVVDFTTYVIVPAYAVAAGGLMPQAWGIAAGCAIAITGALYFADRDMKTADNHFRGFPAVWNVIAFHLLLLRPGPAAAAATVALFVALTFMPIRFVHPFRVRRLRALTVALLAVWAVLALTAVLQGLVPSVWVTTGLCAIALYFLAIGLLPTRQGSVD
jgi:phosphatidylcholine synthase